MDGQVDLTELIGLLWKKKKIIIAITVVFVLLAVLKIGFIDNLGKEEIIEPADEISYYYAQTTFLIKSSEALEKENQYLVSKENDVTDVLISTYSEIIKSNKNLSNIISKLNLNIDVDDLYSLISVSQISKSNLIRVNVAYEDENQALQIANELVSELISNTSDVYNTNEVVVIDRAAIMSDKAIADIFTIYIVEGLWDEIYLSNILTNVDIAKLLSNNYLKTLFNDYVFKDSRVCDASNITIVKNIINPASEDNVSNVIKKTCIAGAVGLILSVGGILTVSLLSNTINSEKDIDAKVLGIIENNSKEDIYDILRIKLEKNKTIVVTTLEENEKATSIVENMVEAFKKNDKKVLLLDSKKNVNISENELKNYDYVIVYAKNILEDASSLMAVQQFKNTVLLVTERKTKLDSYKKAKETLRDVDANLLGSVLIR